MSGFDPRLKGPQAIIVDLDGAWPKSNLAIGGCKHDVREADARLLASGYVVYCAKCGCAMISRETLARLVRQRDEFDA